MLKQSFTHHVKLNNEEIKIICNESRLPEYATYINLIGICSKIKLILIIEKLPFCQIYRKIKPPSITASPQLYSSLFS